MARTTVAAAGRRMRKRKRKWDVMAILKFLFFFLSCAHHRAHLWWSLVVRSSFAVLGIINGSTWNVMRFSTSKANMYGGE